jgi:Pectinacetylesterase
VQPKLDLSTSQRNELFPRFGAPIPPVAPGSWQWIDFPDTAAGDGSPTGLAINFAPDPQSKRLVIYFQAGGACWDYTTASLHLGGYGAVMHLNGFGRSVWERSLTARIHRKMWLFDRDDPTNPFRDAHLVYIPYCTGDIYVGDRVNELRGPLPFMRRTVHFRGQANVRAYLSRLVPTFPELARVYLVGSSAGGFGATFSWWLANEAFRTVPIDVISDAGHPVLVPKAMFDRWIEAWGPRFPHHGEECRRGLRELLEFAERHYLGPDRYALISTRKDAVLSGFFGMRPSTHARYIDELRAEFFDDFRRYPRVRHARYFIMGSYGHTVFPGNQVERARIGKMALRTWLTQMVEEDPAWSSWYEREGAVCQS